MMCDQLQVAVAHPIGDRTSAIDFRLSIMVQHGHDLRHIWQVPTQSCSHQ